MSIDFEREKSWWDSKAPREEQDQGDMPINRALRWREIERHLEGVKTILDVGGATGAFSIPLAQRGFSVTHLDLSPEMIELAKQKAEDLPIQFVEGNSTDLQFADQSFDLVLNMDGAISFCGSEADRALTESCRVARKTVILAVSNRVNLIPVWVSTSIKGLGRISPNVYSMLNHGEWHPDQHADNSVLLDGKYIGPVKAYLPGEVEALVMQTGMTMKRIGGLGSLAQLCGDDVIAQIGDDESLMSEFLDLCEIYDKEMLLNGPGTRGRAGLIAVAERCS